MVKKNEITISFHTLERFDYTNDTASRLPFQKEEFENICSKFNSKILELTKIDEKSNQYDLIRRRKDVLIEKIELFDQQYIAGIYTASYSGHEYENAKHGKIGADVINTRPFFFLLYLSNDGKLYIATQYLGLFGSYEALKYAIITTFVNSQNILSKSINKFIFDDKNYEIKEAQVEFHIMSKDIHKDNIKGTKGVLVLKKSDKNDKSFSDTIKNKLLSTVLTEKNSKKAIHEFLSEKQITFINDDDDIKDCKIILQEKGKKQRILNIIEEGKFATKFPLDVTLEINGHPNYNELKTKTKNLFHKEIFESIKND